MPVFRNPNRLRELFTEEGLQRAVQKLLSYRSKEVLQVFAWAWCLLLSAVFSLLVIIRIALTLPLPWGQ